MQHDQNKTKKKTTISYRSFKELNNHFKTRPANFDNYNFPLGDYITKPNLKRGKPTCDLIAMEGLLP